MKVANYNNELCASDYAHHITACPPGFEILPESHHLKPTGITPPIPSEISMKNWRAKVKPVLTPHL